MAQLVESEFAKTEKVIARPLKTSHENVATYTFRRRYMFSLQNAATTQDELYNIATNVSQGGLPGYSNSFANFAHYPWKILPVKSIMFWMNRGEVTFLMQHDAIKFCHAKFDVHHQSFRTQFVTGTTSVGFANSNMQMHGLLFEDHDKDLPPYNIWLTGTDPRSSTALTVNGLDITQALHGINPKWIGGAPVNPIGAEGQFLAIPWDPWYLVGYVQTPAPTLPIDETQKLTNQYYQIFHRKAEIIGKEVPWGRSYDLRSMWGDKWLANVPHLVPSLTDNSNAQAGYGSESGSGSAGLYWGKLQTVATPTAQDRNAILTSQLVCPARPNVYIQPHANIDTEPLDTTSSRSSLGGVGLMTKGLGQHMTNLLLQVENLPNQDGSIVPIIWDFYMDTEITVEVKFNQHLVNRDYLADTLAPAADRFGQCTFKPDPWGPIDNSDHYMFHNAYAGSFGSSSAGQQQQTAMQAGLGSLGMVGAHQIAASNFYEG